jgi:hypothetical protein
MRTRRLSLAAAAALLAAASALAAADAGFQFTPQPRWNDEPETGDLCTAVAKECPGAVKHGSIDAEVGFDELYDARGMLVGLRLTKSTGCKPLDEYSLVSHREFRMAFHKDDAPDLDAIHAELAPGTDPAAVRIVKADGTSLSIGCD